MTQAHARSRKLDNFDHIVGALGGGLVFVDASGQIVWIDPETRRKMDGVKALDLAISKHDATAVDCILSAVEVEVGGKRERLCVIQATEAEAEAEGEVRDLISAIEDVMSDPSWFTRPLIEKLKAWRQASQPDARASDLEMLTAREREILALICEGRSDAEMARLLGLSQNTVRNHVASLFRKIGVNRRSAAVIWARERALTSKDVWRLSRAGSLRRNTGRTY